MKIKINRNVLLAASLIAGKDESRFIITGICFEVKPATSKKRAQCNVIATDGRRIIVINAGEVMVAPEKKRSAVFAVNTSMLKALPKSSDVPENVEITFGETTATFVAVGSKGVKFDSELMDGTFPTWRQVIPDGAEKPSPIDPCFNWKYLDGFMKAASMLQRDSGVRLRQGDPTSPLLILFPSIPYAFGVFMPLNSSAHTNCVPAFFAETADEPEPVVPPATTETPKAEAVANPRIDEVQTN